jgi:hypothetical protein
VPWRPDGRRWIRAAFELEKLEDAGRGGVLFLNRMGTVPQWAALETIRNIGTHVIPKFKG